MGVFGFERVEQMAAELLSAFLVGLLGGVHCVGMCGGIVGALAFGLPESLRQSLVKVLPFQLAYNVGRVVSYVIAGAIMGGLGMLLAGLMPVYYAQQGLWPWPACLWYCSGCISGAGGSD